MWKLVSDAGEKNHVRGCHRLAAHLGSEETSQKASESGWSTPCRLDVHQGFVMCPRELLISFEFSQV